MIVLYKPNKTDFIHNGIGALDKGTYSATVEEKLNSLFLFSYIMFLDVIIQNSS